MVASPPPIFKLEDLSVRDMCNSDLAGILGIERNAQISPWSRLSFEESLTKSHICRVIEANDLLLAFHIICPVVDEMHILNLAVSPPHQGAGLGHVLLDDIVKLAQQAGSKKIFLEVRIGNQVATNLYRKWQFRQVGLRRNYYRAAPASGQTGESGNKQREDGLVLMRTVQGSGFSS